MKRLILVKLQDNRAKKDSLKAERKRGRGRVKGVGRGGEKREGKGRDRLSKNQE